MLLALLACPVARVSAQALTVDIVGDALKIRAPAFSFLNGDPLARLKDGRSVRVELAALVLAAPGKSPAAATRRVFALSYDLWEERFAVTAVDARSQSVSHLVLAAAEAWCVEQLAVPVRALGALGRDRPFWVRLEYRILDGDAPAEPADSRLHAAGAHRRVEPPPQDRVVAARPRSRSVQAATGRLPLAAMTLRNRLIAAFLASTLLPLGATVWITTSLLDRSLRYATTRELDQLSRTLELTAKQFYQRERDALKQDALAGRRRPTTYVEANAQEWPDEIRSFWESGEAERFTVSGTSGERVDYMRRVDGSGRQPGVEIYSRDLGGIRMDQLSTQVRDTRRLVNAIEERDLRRGFTLALLVLLGAAWLVSLLPLVLIAHRVSRPIQQLTAALSDFAGGDWSRRLETGTSHGAPRDEVGRAVDAFNDMADQLEENRERLVHLTRMASWQSLARKTAHELKNSLTPIRLTVEEMQARQPASERAFMDQAVQIVVSEIESLERRVRAFSEFASEPMVHPEMLDINAVVTERVALLRPVHPGVTYQLKLADGCLRAHADPDLVNGILTNLLQNAAEAAGPGGAVVVLTRGEGERVLIDVHDSGPGLREDVSATLFEPTISFKKHGMGLGLSIAKKNALLSGGDVAVIHGELGGAAFRVWLPS